MSETPGLIDGAHAKKVSKSTSLMMCLFSAAGE